MPKIISTTVIDGSVYVHRQGDTMDATGFYQPHVTVNWTGEKLDPKTGELVKEPSLTKQSFKDECDINNIVRRYETTGILEHLNQRAAQGMFTDLPDALDFQGALNIVAEGQAAFAALPADLRARFGNDPEEFLYFMSDPSNQDEMIKLGLATDTRPPPPVEAPPPIVPPAVAPSSK